eukprot:scaffold16164_cov186-Skeletonema_dohrnii-CCMP3373.AAC.1
MANKAVIGAVAAGIAGYAAKESFKDWQVERERKNREQAQRDREEEMERRLEEKLRKEGVRSFQNEMDDIATNREFQMKVFSHLEEMLFGLTVKVGEGEGATFQNRNHQMLNLPLMSNENDKEDLMLAAAFALGDSNVVDRVAESFSKQKLGIGLKKFTNRSIMNIISVFRSLEDPDIDHASLRLFVIFGIYRNDVMGGKPSLLYPEAKNSPAYSDNLRKWGAKFGIYVSQEACLQMISKVHKKRLRKSDRATFDFVKRFHEVGSGRLILSNFRCAFETPYVIEQDGWDGIRGTRQKLSFSFEEIRLIRSNTARAHHETCKPDLDAIAHAFASKIVAGMACEAAERLSQLLKRRGRYEEGISLEHISIHAGKGGDLLKHLAEADMNMISGHNEIICSTLNDTLLKCVPPPALDEQDLAEGESQQEKLDAEVSAFVDAYLQLVNLSYCEVPLLSGRPPSAFVPKYTVFGEVTQHKDCIWTDNPVLVCGVRRMQIKDERKRLARSRELVAPGALCNFFFVISTWFILTCLCTVATETSSIYIHYIHSHRMHFHIMNQAITLSALYYSLFRMVGRMFNIPVNVDSFDWQCRWKVASYCTECIQRAIAAKLGKPTPYDQQMSKLREQCGSQYRMWKMRIAKRNFHAALKRKRITNKESILLLTEMAESYYETEEEEVVEGVFQAELSDVEEFLKLQVEEGRSCTEATLSPEDAIKNYLDLVSDETGTGRSSLARLCDLSTTIEECVLFSEGDRVLVKFGEEDEDARRGQLTASVVFSTASRVYVHFDGEPAEVPIPVPTHLCSILDEDLPVVEDIQPPLLTYTYAEDFALSAGSESENESIISESEEPPNAPQAKMRSRTVEEALIDGGWELTREKKHIKYSRRVKLTKEGPSQKQTVTLSKTASDWRAERNTLSLLRRLNSEVVGGSPGSVSEEIVTCSKCKEEMPTTYFSKTQLKKGGRKKCKECLSESRMI